MVFLVVLASRATHLLGNTELDIFELFDSLPRGLVALSRRLENVGTLWALGLVVAAAVVARRWRLARDLLLAGFLAWGVSRVLGSDVVGHIGLHASLRTLTHPGTTPSFPDVRLAVVVGVVATAGPYVARPTRRLGQALVAVLVLATLYVGTAYPTDLLGALAVGWGIAAAVHLGFGSPGGRPSATQLTATLAQIGITAGRVQLFAHQGPEATRFAASDADGPLEVNVIGRDELDAQLLSKTWRFVAYKEPPPALQLTRVQQVEHEACMALLAGSAGVCVPRVLFVGRAGPGAALLVVRPLRGALLADLTADDVTDELLAQVWKQVAKLHGTGIAHGALDTTHIVCTAEGPGIVAFATATTAQRDHRQAKDVAELLAGTAAVVGAERAVAACTDALGRTALHDALPFFQPAALGRHSRSALGDNSRGLQSMLDELRRVGAQRAGVEAPTIRQLQRVRPTNLLLAASLLIAVAVLLDKVGNPSKVWDITQRAQWGWATAALVVSLATNVLYAVALMGTLPMRLPLWPTSELQLAMSYSNLVIPVIGGTGFQIRFLQRQGTDLPTAVAAGGLLSVAGTVLTQLPLFALALWLSPDSLDLGNVPVNGILRTVALVVVTLGLVAAVAFGIPRLRRAVLPPVEQALSTIWTALRSRRQLSLIIGGNLGVSLLYGCCLLFCLHAFDANLSFWTVLAVSIGVGTVASLIPIPGGSAAAGALGLTGVLVGLGLSTEAAVAATLANQLTVTYLPAIPGWFATRHLLARNYL